jgi:hypothetical protein
MTTVLPTFSSYKSSLYRQRQKNYHELPETASDVNLEGKWTETLDSSRFLLHHDRQSNTIIHCICFWPHAPSDCRCRYSLHVYIFMFDFIYECIVCIEWLIKCRFKFYLLLFEIPENCTRFTLFHRIENWNGECVKETTTMHYQAA